MGNIERKKQVLIVDDEEDMIWTLQKNLPTEKLPVTIHTASSGEEALTILENTDIDLLVTDIRMPGMSGIDLLIAVRNTYPDIGVIVMTAFPSSESKEEVIEKGGLRFIEKPFDINEMRGFVRNALEIVSPSGGRKLGVQLIDLVQVNNLAKSSSALRIKANGKEGSIFFDNGNIVHAVYKDEIGEEAFYSLMKNQGGEIETFQPEALPEKTINSPVGALLLKGFLLSDKERGNIDYLEELDLGLQPARKIKVKQEAIEFPASLSDVDIDEDEVPVPEENESTASEKAYEKIYYQSFADEQNKKYEEEEMENVKDLLGEFTNIPGVNTACLVGRDGFLLNSVALSGIDSEMIGAIASSGFGASESMGNQLEKGNMSMTMVEYTNGPVMLAPVGSDAFLVIVADKDANLGMIRLKIKKHSHDIMQTAGI